MRAAEFDEVGALRVRAYQELGFLSASSAYTETLRTLGGDILVADDGGTVAGTVALQTWGPSSEVARGPDEIEMRAFAVAPAAQGRGVGRALVDAAVERARAAGLRHLVLSTQPGMLAAQRIYRAAGFERLPDRDWSPVPGLVLLAFGLRLS